MFEDKIEAMNKLPNAVDDSSGFEKRVYTVEEIMDIVEFIWVDGKRRIKRESFDKWYASQSKYTKVKEIEEVEGYVD